MRPIGGALFAGAVCYIKNICDRKYVSDRVVAPLVRFCTASFRGDFASLLQSAAFSPCADCGEALAAILGGSALVAVETDRLYCVSVPADSFAVRAIKEPDSDVTVRGPRAGFTESGEINLVSLRRIVKSAKLKALSFTVGKLTATKVSVVYFEGRASEKTVARICASLESADADCVVDSANIEQLLCPRGGLFPTLGSSEKADKVASKVLAGRVAVICDGSPFVLTAPYVFAECIQSAEDYLKSAWYATFMRFLRFFALLASLFLPALFVSAVYHQRFLIPKGIVDALADMEKDIKLPFIGEMLLMLTAFEVVREVGVRMPRTVGDAVGIVASLLVGDATVEAGLAGTATLLIVAFSETAGFIAPAVTNALTLLRYLYILAAYFAGMYGLLFAFGLTFLGLLRKKSFGVGYMTPLCPFSAKGLEDFLIVKPKKVLGRREHLK